MKFEIIQNKSTVECQLSKQTILFLKKFQTELAII